MKTIDWGLVQVQYEIFGESPKDIAEAYDTTPRMIEYAAEQRGWKRLPVAAALQNWTDIEKLEDVSEELIEEVNKRMNIMRTIKLSALTPRFIALETAILGKALELLQNLAHDDIQAPLKLKMVAEVLKSLKDQNGMAVESVQNGQNGQGGTSIKVNILNQAAPGESPNKGDLSIEIDGGHTVAPRVAPPPTPADA